MSRQTDNPQRAEGRPAKKASSATLNAEERAAMRELAKERKAQARGEDANAAVLAKIAEMPEPDRAMAERFHALVTANAPTLSARTWYGMPAYAKDGKILCFFQSAAKFKARYATVGFTDEAHLDDGHMWAASFALTELTSAEEEKIAELLKRAVAG